MTPHESPADSDVKSRPKFGATMRVLSIDWITDSLESDPNSGNEWGVEVATARDAAPGRYGRLWPPQLHTTFGFDCCANGGTLPM